MTAHPQVGTPSRILDVAERLVQTRGFNGFSYADISAELELTTASLHYHFPAKADLGRSLLDRYQTHFQQALGANDQPTADAPMLLRRYIELHAAMLEQNRICLGGMLAANCATLPTSMKKGVRTLFGASETWLGQVLEDGRRAQTVHFQGSGSDAARFLVASIAGAMMFARVFDDVGRFRSVANLVLAHFGANHGSR